MKKFVTLLILSLAWLNLANKAQACTILQQPSTLCDEAVQLSIQSPVSTLNYSWDIDGDMIPDMNGNSILYDFGGPGSYTVNVFEDGSLCTTEVVEVFTSPDVQIGIPPGVGIMIGNDIRTCTTTPVTLLELSNLSSTILINASYSIDWGDGSGVEVFTNATFNNAGVNASHTYSSFGFYTISISITTVDGCTGSEVYTYYNGGNPSIGLATPGNTVSLCSPASVSFPITDYQSNPPGTMYTVFVNGDIIEQYTQDNIPAFFTYNFEDSSCGNETSTGNYMNAFDVQIEATNPCGSSSATVEPIEISLPPEPEMEVDEPDYECPDNSWTFTNITEATQVISGSPSTCSDIIASWSISPGVPFVDWTVISGNLGSSDEITVIFNTPGTYTVDMFINSFACGLFTDSHTFEVLVPTDVAVNVLFSSSEGCAPHEVNFVNMSTGSDANFQWEVNPSGPFNFLNSTNLNTTDLDIEFLAAGSYEVSLSASNDCGTAVWDTIVNITGPPSLELTPIPDFCASASIWVDESLYTTQDSGAQITEYLWSFPGGSPSSASGPAPGSIQYDTPGDYTISLTITNACGTASESSSFTIQAPPLLELPNDTLLCISAGNLLLEVNPEGGNWSGQGVNSGGLFAPQLAGIGLHELTYTYTEGLCTQSEGLEIEVVPLPEIELEIGLTEICINSTPILLSANPDGGVWSLPDGGTLIGSTFVPDTEGSFTVEYTYEDEFGCSNSQSEVITVHPLPVVAVGDTTYCDSDEIVWLPLGSPLGGEWSGPGVVDAEGGTFSSSLAGGIGIYTLTYTFINSNGCVNSTNMEVEVTSPPIVDAGDDFTLCLNDEAVDLNDFASPPGGSWSVSGINTSSIFDPSLLGVGTFIFTYEYGVGSCAVSSDVEIQVFSLPELTYLSQTSACVAESCIELLASPSGGQWSSSNGGVIQGNCFNPNASGVGTFSLTYSYQDTNSCSNSMQIEIEVYSLPNLIVSDTIYCNAPGSFGLPIPNLLGGTWSGPGVVGSNEFSPTVAGGVGSYLVTYSYTDAQFCSNSVDISIEVIEVPELILAGNQALCLNDGSIDLSTLANIGGGIWSGPGLNMGQFDPNLAGVGIHTLTYIAGQGSCTSTASLEIEVYELPLIELSLPQGVCVAVEELPLVASPSGGVWSVDNGGIISGDSFMANLSGSGTYQLSYTYVDGNSCASVATHELEVYELPTLIVSDTSYCATPGVVGLPFASPIGGVWSGTGITDGAGLFDPLAVGVGTHTLTYSYTDPLGCSNTAQIAVSVVAPPPIFAGNDLGICLSSAPIDLSLGATPSGGVWLGTGVSGAFFDPQLSGLGMHTLIYSYGEGNCQVWDTLEIEVYDLPEVTVEAALYEACESVEEIELFASPAGGVWTSGNGGVLSSSNVFSPSQSGVGSYVLSYSFEDANQCSNTSSLEILVYDLPIISVSDSSYCSQGGPVNLPLASPGGGVWSGPSLLDSSTGLINPQMTPGSYTYTYSFTDANLCANSAEIQVEILPPPSISAGQDQGLCLYEEVFDLSSNAFPTGGMWSGAGLVDGDSFDPMLAGVGVHPLIYTVGSLNCQVWDTLWIEVFELPVIDVSSNVEVICMDVDSIELVASPIGGQWSSPDGGVIQGNFFFPIQSGTGIYTLRYEFINSNNCTSEEEILLTVNSLPNILLSDTTYCQAEGLVNLPLASPLGGSWTGPGVVDPTGVLDPSGLDPNQIHNVFYSYTDANGCSDQSSMEVSIIPLPPIDAGPDTTLCIDQGIYQLVGYSPTQGGVWSGDGIVDPINGLLDPSLLTPGVHTLEFSTGQTNCVQVDYVDIEIVDLSEIVSAGEDQEFCAYEGLVNLMGASPTGGLWSGPGVEDALLGTFNPSQLGIGDHQVSYTYLDQSSGCSYTAVKTIRIRPIPQSDFQAAEVSCLLSEVSFSNLSNDTYSSVWHFSDLGQSTQTDPTFTFDQVGTYPVTLVSTNIHGCTDSTSQEILIVESPTVVYALDNESGCGPLEVEFENLSEGYDLSYFWNFGNGMTSTEASPTPITFDMGGDVVTYDISLVVTNLCGQSSMDKQVSVHPKPQVNFGPEINMDCSPMEVTFANATQGLAESYLWDFGNGNSSIDSIPPMQIYYANGEPQEYSIRLIATNSCGVDTMIQSIIVNPPNVNAFVNLPLQEGCLPFTPNINNLSTPGSDVLWDFGDGNTSIAFNPVHTYTQEGNYTISLKAFNGCGFDSTLVDVVVRPSPEIDLEADTDYCAGQEVLFDNLSTGAQGFIWDFGDGSPTSMLANPTHTFETPGLYLVELSGVNASTLCEGADSMWINIRELPDATFSPTIMAACPPMEVSFTAQSNTDLFYSWEFGDGTFSVDPNPTHTYMEEGFYEAQLSVSDAFGCLSSYSISDLQVYPSPVADFEILGEDLCTPATVNFISSSQGADQYNWDFGNGILGGTQSETQIYESGGAYPVSLAVLNTYGCRDEMVKEIDILDRPDLVVDLLNPSGCSPLVVEMENMSLHATEYFWSISGVEDPIGSTPSIVLNEAGNYSVEVIGINQEAYCADTLNLIDAIEVYPRPTANFDWVDFGNGMIQFENQSLEAQSFIWNFGDGNWSEEESPMHAYYGNGDWQVSLEAISSFNCTDTILLDLDNALSLGFYVPNAFSPDFGEGEVKVFKTAGLGVKDYIIEVFSPWGQQLWQSSDLDGEIPVARWDGNFKGNPMPQGAYAWKAKVEFINGARKVYTGTVSLLR